MYQGGMVTSSVTTAYFLSSASFCRHCRALTKAVGSKRGGREPGRGGRGGGQSKGDRSCVLSPLLRVCSQASHTCG